MFGVDDIAGGVLGLLNQIIPRLFPDPAQAQTAKLKLLEMQQSGELAQLAATTDLAKGQMEINKQEAASGSLFVAGWRPMVGWACAAGVATQFLIGPLATWVAALCGKVVVFPALDMGTLVPLLFGMLGLAGMRTAEKMAGVTK